MRFGLVIGSILKKNYNIPYIFSEYCVETANNTFPVNSEYKTNHIIPQLKEKCFSFYQVKNFQINLKIF